MNENDKTKIRVASRLYLLRNGEATSKTIREYMVASNIPMISDVNSNVISRVLRSTKAAWGFKYRKNNRNDYVWFLNEGKM